MSPKWLPGVSRTAKRKIELGAVSLLEDDLGCCGGVYEN